MRRSPTKFRERPPNEGSGCGGWIIGKRSPPAWEGHHHVSGCLRHSLRTGVSRVRSASQDIQASYVSPVMYQSYNCQQIAMEAQSVSTRAAQVAGVQDQQRTNDAIATGAAVVVFWPAAFLVGGNRQAAAELANLRGQMVALEQASIQKRCGIQFQQAPAQAQGR